MITNRFSRKIVTVTLALAFLGTSVQAAESNVFSDVKKGAWYEDTLEWGLSKNMIKGYTDGTFKPNNTVTEAEFLTMLLRAYEPNLLSSAGQHWSEAYYKRAKELNYPVKSYTDLATRDDVVLRKQVAELISSTEGVNFNGNNAIHYLLAFGLAEGTDPNEVSIKSFNGDKKLTRAEALQFVKNFAEYGIGGLLPRPTTASDPNELPPLQL